jgi:hypothetical protein
MLKSSNSKLVFLAKLALLDKGGLIGGNIRHILEYYGCANLHNIVITQLSYTEKVIVKQIEELINIKSGNSTLLGFTDEEVSNAIKELTTM